jgi:hypothetical protein
MDDVDTLLPEPANPGANQTIPLWDSSTRTNKSPTRTERKIMVTVFANQIVTVLFSVKSENGSFRAANGAGDATTASTLFQKEYLLTGYDQKVELVTTTAPTVWEVSGKLTERRASAT